MRCPWCDGLIARDDGTGHCTECGNLLHPSKKQEGDNRYAIKLCLAAQHILREVRELNFDFLSEEDEKNRKKRKEEISHEIKFLLH